MKRLLQQTQKLLKECRDALQCHARQETKDLRERLVTHRNDIDSVLSGTPSMTCDEALKIALEAGGCAAELPEEQFFELTFFTKAEVEKFANLIIQRANQTV